MQKRKATSTGHGVDPVSVRCSVCELALDDDHYLEDWLTCQSCFISLHIRCYCDSTPSSKHWRCERCAAGSTDPCAVCGEDSGAMQLIDHDNAPTMPQEATSKQAKDANGKKRKMGWISRQEERLLLESAASGARASFWKHVNCIGKAPGVHVRSLRPNRGIPPKQLQQSEEYLNTCVLGHTRLGQLQQSLRGESPKKPKKPELSDCPFCDKTSADFVTGAKQLAIHISQHHARGHKPIEDTRSCPYCDKAFQHKSGNKSTIRQHITSCTKKHSCHGCDKTTMDYNRGVKGLKQHAIRQHSDRRKASSLPTVCPYCDKVAEDFASLGRGLKQHIAKGHKEHKSNAHQPTTAAVALNVPPHKPIDGSIGVLCAIKAPAGAGAPKVGAEVPSPSASRVAEDVHEPAGIQATTLLKSQYDSSLSQMQQLMNQAHTPLNQMILEREVAFVNTLCQKLGIAEFDCEAIARSWK